MISYQGETKAYRENEYYEGLLLSTFLGNHANLHNFMRGTLNMMYLISTITSIICAVVLQSLL